MSSFEELSPRTAPVLPVGDVGRLLVTPQHCTRSTGRRTLSCAGHGYICRVALWTPRNNRQSRDIVTCNIIIILSFIIVGPCPCVMVVVFKLYLVTL